MEPAVVCMSSPKLTLKFSSSGEVVRGVGMAVVEVGPSGVEVKFSHNSAGCQFPRGGDPEPARPASTSHVISNGEAAQTPPLARESFTRRTFSFQAFRAGSPINLYSL